MLIYGVQIFFVFVGIVISICLCCDLGFNIGFDFIIRNFEGFISKIKQNYNFNMYYIRGVMLEKNYGVLYMSCLFIWYKQYCFEIYKLYVFIFSIRCKIIFIKRIGQLWLILMCIIFREIMLEKKNGLLYISCLFIWYKKF